MSQRQIAATDRRLSISVAMPVYNERDTLAEIVRKVKAVDRDKEIIIVDDASTDGTREMLAAYETDPEIRVIYQPQNCGKGATLQRAFAAATKDIIIVQDADLEYDPEDYTQLLAPIEAGIADVVYGSRFQYGGRRVLNFWHSLGNKFLTFLSNCFTNLDLTDMETCYKAFKRPVLQNIVLDSRRFGFEPEITAKLARLPVIIHEVPIRYYGRGYEEGKKITWRDGVAAICHIVRYSLGKRPSLMNADEFERALVRTCRDPVARLDHVACEQAPV
ncbi:MAG: glycosyltransferase family 2 protein [Planctomycetota bacterium]